MKKTASKGGLLVGSSHKEGGIDIITPEGKIEAEGNEIILTKGVYESDEKVKSVITPDMTKREAASALNESEGGVKIAEKGTKIETASHGVKINDMKPYYLKVGNVFVETNGGKRWGIKSHTPNGVNLCEYSALVPSEKTEYVAFDTIVANITDKRVSIDGIPFENDRDLHLLLSDIELIRHPFTISEYESKFSKLKQSHNDTMAGVEALAAKGRHVKSELPEGAEKFLAKFPDNATSWADATDEIRDMARTAKEYYNEITLDVLKDDPKALPPLDFQKLKTPSAWNTEGKKYIRSTYSKMNPQAKEQFIDRFCEWFGIAAKGKKVDKSEWLVEDEDEKRRVILSSERPQVGKTYEKAEWEGGHDKVKVSKVIEKDITKHVAAKGAKVKNQYEGKSYIKIWNSWDKKQREHFILDHINEYENIPAVGIKDFANIESFDKLPHEMKISIAKHIEMGQYSGGGITPADAGIAAAKKDALGDLSNTLKKLTKTKGKYVAKFTYPKGGKKVVSSNSYGADIKSTRFGGKDYAKTITFEAKGINRKEALKLANEIASKI